MADPPAAHRNRRPFTILAIFAAALVLQGMSLAVFHGERQAPVSAKSSVVLSNVFTVTTVLDNVPGSLREAVELANASPGHDFIVIDVGAITMSLTSPLEILDPVSLGPHITDVIVYQPIDASQVEGAVFVMTNHGNTRLEGLRIIGASTGYGISTVGVITKTVIANVSIENSMGGIQIGGGDAITVTNVGLFDIGGTGVEVKNSKGVHLGGLVLSNIGDTGVHVSDGVTDMLVLSSTISGIQEEFGAGITLAGDPAPTGVVMRGNMFTGTFQPIFLGPGANFDFPAPEVLGATLYPDGTVELNFLSKANPISYTYPLDLDLYRVRDGNYFPIGATVPYSTADHDIGAITATIPLVTKFLETGDDLAVIATTANPNTSEFSLPVELSPPPDTDGDGVIDGDDLCPDTVIPEATAPSHSLGKNRFALVDDDLTFDTVLPEGEGPTRSYTTTETGGCSCEQIIEELGLGEGHTRFGCTISAMDAWVAGVEAASKGESPDASRSEVTPGAYVLDQNYPNPFNPVTTITFELPEQQRVVLRVFDVMGRVVATLLDADLDQGTHRVMWDGRNARGQFVASGLYIYRIEAGDFSTEKTMNLLR